MKEIVRYGYVSLASLISLRCPECEFDTKKDNNLEDLTIKKHPVI